MVCCCLVLFFGAESRLFIIDMGRVWNLDGGGDFVCIGCKLPSKKELRDNTVFRNGSGVTIGMKIFLTEKIYLSTMCLMMNFHFSSRTPF